jgi:hypothetical protein
MLDHNAPSNLSSRTDWAGEEFAHAELPDPRLVKRLIIVATDFAQHPTAPLPQACGSWDKAKAAYRFFDNDAVQPEAILAAQATLERMQAHPIVLCPQDTTTLNYWTHRQTQGLDPISNNRSKTIGLLLHSTLAISPAGQPLGLLYARSWARTTRTFGRCSHARKPHPPHAKGKPEVDGQLRRLPESGRAVSDNHRPGITCVPFYGRSRF